MEHDWNINKLFEYLVKILENIIFKKIFEKFYLQLFESNLDKIKKFLNELKKGEFKIYLKRKFYYERIWYDKS